jgi:NTE family protein
VRLGLSLGAGGARGWAHLGVLRALEEKGVRVDLVNGTSIGAVVGGAYALYQSTEKMFAIAKQAVDTANVNYFNIFRHSSNGASFIHNILVSAICDIAALRSFLVSHKNNIKALEILFGDYKFHETKIPFLSVATDLVSRKLVSIQKGRLVDGILPSISIPGIFPPIRMDDYLLVDGGVLANVPIRELRQSGAEFVIAVRLVAKTEPKFNSGFELLSYIDSLKFNEINKRELANADFVLDVDTTGLDGGKFDDYEIAISTGYLEAKKHMSELTERLDRVFK